MKLKKLLKDDEMWTVAVFPDGTYLKRERGIQIKNEILSLPCTMEKYYNNKTLKKLLRGAMQDENNKCVNNEKRL